MSLTTNPLWCLLPSQPLLRSRVIRTTWVCVVLKRKKVIVQYYVCWVKCQCALSRHGYKGQGVPVYQIRIKSFTFSTVLSEYVPKVSREECFYNIHKITTTTKIKKSREKKIGRCQTIQVLCRDLLQQHVMSLLQKADKVSVWYAACCHRQNFNNWQIVICSFSTLSLTTACMSNSLEDFRLFFSCFPYGLFVCLLVVTFSKKFKKPNKKEINPTSYWLFICVCVCVWLIVLHFKPNALLITAW